MSFGKASTICWAVQWAVGCSVTLKWTTRRRWGAKHEEDEEHPQARGGDREEIEGDQVSDVVGEERAPGLRRGCAPLRHQPGNGSLGHLDAELPEFAMDSRGAPRGIHRRHFSDEGGDLRVDRRAAHPRAAGEPRPVLMESTALPPQDSVGRHDDQSLPPAGPDSGQPNPQQAIHRAQSGPRHRSFVHGELLTQGEVLQGELAVAAAEEREESNQVEHEGDHQARILSGSELIDQPLAHRMEFWRRTTTQCVVAPTIASSDPLRPATATATRLCPDPGRLQV